MFTYPNLTLSSAPTTIPDAIIYWTRTGGSVEASDAGIEPGVVPSQVVVVLEPDRLPFTFTRVLRAQDEVLAFRYVSADGDVLDIIND